MYVAKVTGNDWLKTSNFNVFKKIVFKKLYNIILYIYKNQRFSNIKKIMYINNILLFIDSNFELNL